MADRLEGLRVAIIAADMVERVELAPAARRQLEQVAAVSTAPQQLEPVRIRADATSAAELMRRLVGNPHVDARLVEEDGHWYVELRAPALAD